MKPLERTIDLASMVAYGGATWDWNRMHYDAGYAADRNLRSPIVDGQMLGALLAEHAMASAGRDAFPTTMSFRYRAMVFAGDTVRVDGSVAVEDDDTVTIDQTISVGEKVVVTGQTTLRRLV
jgi:acyl dehydratase